MKIMPPCTNRYAYGDAPAKFKPLSIIDSVRTPNVIPVSILPDPPLILIPPIATMATMIVIRGLAQYITNSVVISLPDYLRKLNSLKIGGIYIDIFIAAIVLILTEIVHRRTSFGRYVTTIGNDKKVAEKLGVNVRKTTVKMYVYSALMAGVAGMFFSIFF